MLEEIRRGFNTPVAEKIMSLLAIEDFCKTPF